MIAKRETQRDKRAPLRQYIYSQDSKSRNGKNYKWKHFHSVFRGVPSFIQKEQLLLMHTFPLNFEDALGECKTFLLKNSLKESISIIRKKV